MSFPQKVNFDCHSLSGKIDLHYGANPRRRASTHVNPVKVGTNFQAINSLSYISLVPFVP